MAISEPVSIYTAANCTEAHLLCGYLEQNGIDAHVTEDNPLIGGWLFGLLPQIHKPQVWIDRTKFELATQLLEAYERDVRERLARPTLSPIETDFIGVVCEECGTKTPFPASQNGTIQECPRCEAYVDVGEPDDPESGISESVGK